MKKYAIFTILIVAFVYLVSTGFQCQSSEMTSAKLYIQRSDYPAAENALMKEVEKKPTNGEAWWLLGHSRVNLGKYKLAVEAFNQSLKNSNEFTDKITQSKKFIWGQTLNMGVGYFNKSLTASPESVNIYLDKSIENYNIALSVNSDSIITYQNMAVAYHAKKLYDEEIGTLKQGLSHKKSPQLYTSLINIYLLKAQDAEAASKKDEATANFNNAIATIQEARQSDPNNDELLATMIDIYVRTGRANDAKPYINEAIQRDPGNKIYQYNLGVLLMQGDSLEEAVTHFNAALQTDPNYDAALQNAGIAFMRLGDKIKKSMQSEDAKQKDENKFLEKFKKATEYFKKLADLRQTDPNAYDLLASGYANSNMLKEAKEALEKADSLRKK